MAWVVNLAQPYAATNARGMYSSNYVESDLINSYSWDTAIVFIQKYSGNANYAGKTSVNRSKLNTGMSGDKVCNIYDMASNCYEWTTEYSTRQGSGNNSSVYRGGFYSGAGVYSTVLRTSYPTTDSYATASFRPLCYVK